MNRACFDLSGFDAHANNDTVNGFDGCFRLVFPSGHCLLDVLVEGFNLNRSKLETLEPFLVIGFRQRLWRIVGEKVAWGSWGHKKAAWIKGRS